MPRIIKIIPLKRKKQILLELEDGGPVTVQQETLVDFNLFPGMELPEEQYMEMLEHDRYKAAQTQAVRYLARRSHSKKELETKLLQKGFAGQVIRQVIAELEEKKYLDDEAFLRSFIKDRLNFSRKGRNLIVQELLKKGYSREAAEDVLQELIVPGEELENARFLARKKWETLLKKPQKQRIIKVKQHLIQKGYPFKMVDKVVLELSDIECDEPGDLEL